MWVEATGVVLARCEGARFPSVPTFSLVADLSFPWSRCPRPGFACLSSLWGLDCRVSRPAIRELLTSCAVGRFNLQGRAFANLGD